MYKCMSRQFLSSKNSKREDTINKWLCDHPNINIVSVNQSEAMIPSERYGVEALFSITITIFYYLRRSYEKT